MRRVSFVLSLALLFAFFMKTTAFSADFLSIPAAALIPKDDSISYSTNGSYMGTDMSQAAVFYAPVFLPDNATITDITLLANDSSGGASGGYVELELLSHYRYSSPSVIETLHTGGDEAGGNVEISESEVNTTVDNSQYAYGIIVVLHNGSAPSWSVLYYQCIIEYTSSAQTKTVVIPLFD